MEWSFIFPHLFGGYIPVVAVLAVYYILLYVMRKKPTIGHILASYVFCFYLIGILTMTGVCLRGSFSPRIVYIPFVDMIRGPVDTVLNILLFIPLGVFLPMLYSIFDSARKTALAGFLVSLSVEMAQMFEMGTTDINDLITNTLGACLGYGIYQVIKKTIPKSWEKQIQVQGCCEWLLFWAGSMLIMLTA